jgi:hypothetical protein
VTVHVERRLLAGGAEELSFQFGLLGRCTAVLDVAADAGRG